MAYKDILVYADAAKSVSVRLDVAASLAAKHKAHLTALHVLEPPYVPAAVVEGGLTPALLGWQQNVVRERADAAKKAVEAARRRSGEDIEWRAVDGETIATVLLHARYADLVVVSQSGGNDEDMVVGDNLPEEILMSGGRPEVIVPRYGAFATVGERVLIAWNRSREAARAVHDALPLLVTAKSVTVMEVNPERQREPHLAGADIALHLARHGVKAEVASTTARNIDVSDVILSRAADLGIDLLVIGGYGHSRLREYTFGGVTRHILDHMTIPVLMSH
jgi:nucleotide-binding universal stress UspA family protein